MTWQLIYTHLHYINYSVLILKLKKSKTILHPHLSVEVHFSFFLYSLSFILLLYYFILLSNHIHDKSYKDYLLVVQYIISSYDSHRIMIVSRVTISFFAFNQKSYHFHNNKIVYTIFISSEMY